MSGDTSARLGLPYLAAGQLQKHVTLNEALTRLDGLVQTRVVSRTVGAQPSSPDDGDLYVLPAATNGVAWAGKAAGTLIRAELGAWTVVAPVDGQVVWVKDEGLALIRHQGGWRLLGAGLGEVQALGRLGLNTTADATNPFAAKINKALWAALSTGEGGDGDLRMTFSKQAAGGVASLLFQSGYSGRAELGLIGDDDLRLKVSADGSTWRSAFAVSRTTGAVDFPAGCGRIETTVFVADGTYVVPGWARRIEALVVGGGGGGGAGAAGAMGVSRFGGGGGGAGGVSTAAWATTDLASSLIMVVGAAGVGGAGGSAAVGSTGASGDASSIASSGVVLVSGTGGNGGQGGGGAGGGLNSSNTVRAGGAGATGGVLATPAAGGARGSGAFGSPGAAPTVIARSWGGGGGGGAAVTTGYIGGVGASGAGGGGGGAGVTASGGGGAGGSGLIRIVAIG